MSMSFYAYRVGPYGTEFSDGPHFSNANALRILRSLGYGEEILDHYRQPEPSTRATSKAAASQRSPSAARSQTTACPR